MTDVYLTTPGAGTWIVPIGVTSVQIECWGGGGSGGYRATSGQSATAGGGGGWSRTNALAVTPGQTVYYYVGAGGVSRSTTSQAGQDGEATWVNKNSNTTPASTSDGCLAVRGRAGAQATSVAAGAATTSTGHIGDTVRNSRNTTAASSAPAALGGSGASGPNGQGSLGGQNTGEGPGYQGDATSGGAGGSAGGGNGTSNALGGGGGGGMNSSAAPAGDGGLPGGGGGGGVNPATRSGAGGSGQIKLTYTASSTAGRRTVIFVG